MPANPATLLQSAPVNARTSHRGCIKPGFIPGRPVVPGRAGSRPNSGDRVGSPDYSGKDQARNDDELAAGGIEGKAPGSVSPAERLLQTEAEIRRLGTESEIRFHLVNQMRGYVRYRQAFWIDSPSRPKVIAASSLSRVDRTTPLIRWIESVVACLGGERSLKERQEFCLPAYADADPETAKQYPFKQFLWVPMPDRDGKLLSGVLLSAEAAWTAGSVALADRLVETYAHALGALGKNNPIASRFSLRPWWPWLVSLAVLSLFLPFPMSALAPAEVVAHKPQIITAPISGVVRRIEVQANAAVKAGEILARLEDTELRNQLEVAEQAVLLAQAGLEQATGSAFDDPSARRELAIARSQLQLKRAERSYYQALLDQTVIRAPADGLAVFENAQQWLGKPVAIGERIMALADPSKIDLRVDLGVDDAITLQPGAPVRLFLHADPLNPVDATVRHAAYRAEPTPEGALAYQLTASFNKGQDHGADPNQTVLRIGLRGIAKISGESVALGYFLFRRPISAARQAIGW